VSAPGRPQTAEETRVFHAFCDADLAKTPEYPSGRYGPSAVGIALLDAKGKTVAERAFVIGTHTNNRGELLAILHSTMLAIEMLPVPQKSKLVVHTDSRLAYRGLKFDELHKEHLVAVRNAIRELATQFREVDYRLDPRDCKAIRRAEHLARKALGKAIGKKLTRRGSKGRRHKVCVERNPYRGQLL
jgi:ribonuclease HI